MKWKKLSCRKFKDNQTHLQLFALAYNMANFLRRLARPSDVKHSSLTTLREKLVKIGAKVTRHSQYVTFQRAEVAVTRNLFAAILDRIPRLALPSAFLIPFGKEHHDAKCWVNRQGTFWQTTRGGNASKSTQ